MNPLLDFSRFRKDESGSILVLFAVSIAVLLGLMALIYDIGRLGATKAELQSYADSVALTAAAELDGYPDAITRAQKAGNQLISGKQTFGTGAKTLAGAASVTLTYFRPDNSGKFDRSLTTSNPKLARFVEAKATPLDVKNWFARAANAASADSTTAAATSVAGFELRACNATPVAVCLSADVKADVTVGQSFNLSASVGVPNLQVGRFAPVDLASNLLDGLSVCATAADVKACLLASKSPADVCMKPGGFKLDVNLNASKLSTALNDRLQGLLDLLSLADLLLSDKTQTTVFAAIDCTSANLNASATLQPVQYFEGKISKITSNSTTLKVTACLGGNCSGGVTKAIVYDRVRLIE
jgi:Flp pilus assembly protein TadG